MKEICDDAGTYLATLRDNGDFYHYDTYIGSAEPGGRYTWHGRYVAHVTKNGTIMRRQEHLGHVRHSGGGFFGLSALASLLFSPFMLVMFLIGLLLWFLTGFVQKTGAIVTAVAPYEFLIWGAGALGLVFLIIRRVAGRSAPLGWMSVAGTWLVFLCALWFFAYRVGLIAVWAFPAGFAGREEYDPLLRAGFVGAPGAQRIYEAFQNWINSSDKFILNQGVGGVLQTFENLQKSAMGSGMNVLLVLIICLMLIVLGFVFVLAFIFLVPFLSLLAPFLPAVLTLSVIGSLLSIGWE